MLNPAENLIATVSQPVKKTRDIKRIIVRIVLLLLTVLILASLGYFLRFYSISTSGIKRVPKYLLKDKIAGYDVRLFKFILKERNLTREEVFKLVKNDCQEINLSKDNLGESFRENLIYTKELQKNLIISLGLNSEKTEGLLFTYEDVPETNLCKLIWIVDSEGRGIAGYEASGGGMKFYRSRLPKDMIDSVLKYIP